MGVAYSASGVGLSAGGATWKVAVVMQVVEKLPVIVFTNAYVANMIHEAFSAGASGVYNKSSVTPRQIIDVITTMLDDTLPLTPPEWQEWGNPIEDAQAFRTMLGYSPYDNVRAQAYPAMLVLAGLTDPRVTYWEPAKWVAKLRELNTGSKLIALKTNMDAGHGGAAGRFDRLKEVALSYAFAIDVAKNGAETSA